MKSTHFGLATLAIFSFATFGSGGSADTDDGRTGSTSGGIGTHIPAPTGNQTYDNRVGLGSDANGVPILKRHTKARYIYWNPNHVNASDSNAGADPNYPKATPISAWNALRNGYGDWLLMAQGASHAAGFGQVSNRSGLNAQYPIVITTYNPAAPMDVAQMRQGTVTLGTHPTGWVLGFDNFSGQNIVFENIDFDQPQSSAHVDTSVAIINWQTGSSKTLNFLFHNVRFLRTPTGTTSGGDTTPHYLSSVIFRHCVFAFANRDKAWSHAQGMFLWGTVGYTIEDSIFYHNGWSNDGTRATASNPPTMFNHNAYFGTLTFNTVFRRNVSGRSSSHGLQLRGGGVAHDNVFINNPVGLIIGGGDEYTKYRPAGVPYDVRNNVIIGAEDIDAANPRGFGVGFENTQDGGVFDNNIIANIGVNSTNNKHAFTTTWISSQMDAPTYINMTNNIMWRWNPNYANNTYETQYTLANRLTTRTYPAQLHFTHSGDIIHFDNAPMGTNRRAPATTFPDPTRDLASYAAANHYASETSLWEAMIANPKAAWAKSIGDYIRAGYGR
jgi:hypothetical protein